jgi:hypothetical protein
MSKPSGPTVQNQSAASSPYLARISAGLLRRAPGGFNVFRTCSTANSEAARRRGSEPRPAPRHDRRSCATSHDARQPRSDTVCRMLADCFFDPGTAMCLTRATNVDRKMLLTALCQPTRRPNVRHGKASAGMGALCRRGQNPAEGEAIISSTAYRPEARPRTNRGAFGQHGSRHRRPAAVRSKISAFEHGPESTLFCPSFGVALRQSVTHCRHSPERGLMHQATL